MLVISDRAVVQTVGAEHGTVRASVPHRFPNAPPTEPLRIFRTYASADARLTLVATGETRRMAEEGE